MNKKLEITKYVSQQLGLPLTDKTIKRLVHLWWHNPRLKDQGGMRLTYEGFEALKRADIKCYEVKLEDYTPQKENKFILWLDRSFDCPFIIYRKQAFIFEEQSAVQLVLFSGNIQKFIRAKNRYFEKSLEID